MISLPATLRHSLPSHRQPGRQPRLEGSHGLGGRQAFHTSAVCRHGATQDGPLIPQPVTQTWPANRTFRGADLNQSKDSLTSVVRPVGSVVLLDRPIVGVRPVTAGRFVYPISRLMEQKAKDVMRVGPCHASDVRTGLKGETKSSRGGDPRDVHSTRLTPPNPARELLAVTSNSE